MATLVFYLSVVVLFIQPTVAFNCSAPPIYVDIHRRAVHESSEFQYGSFIGVGIPAQNHSLWPSLSQNHTSFAASGYCQNSTLKDCQTSTGGFFARDDSTTYKNDDKFQPLDTDQSMNGIFLGTIGRDTLHLYTHYFETNGAWQTNVEDAVVEVAEEGTTSPGVVGVGFRSTLLETLVSKGMIAGRTYSLYIGHGFRRAGGIVNGSNVFGGFDAGRFTGPVHSYKMNELNSNPLSVRVKDIIITDTISRVNVSLFSTTDFPSMKAAPASFEAQINTDQYPLSLPLAITQNFISHLGAEKDNTWGDNSLRLKNPFNGTLSIVLDDGFTVTLPAEVLSNASNITPIQDRDEDSTAPFYLSTAFLTQVYLMADFDSYTFHLAEAVQKNNRVMPQTFCPKTVPVAYVGPKRSAWVMQGLIGAVAGGVIGSIGLRSWRGVFSFTGGGGVEGRKWQERWRRGRR